MSHRDLSGRTLGDFVLREQIGEGGYGAVYRAEQPSLEREVVVKVLHEGRRDEEQRQRFLREARLASRLDHLYAAHVYAFGADAVEGLWWIAMERVHGVTLAQWLEQHGPMPLEQFVPFCECVADVVSFAHKRGIIHRDLKPSNIMVIESGDRIVPKLLDFGIARDLKVRPRARRPSGPNACLAETHEAVEAPGTDASGQVRRHPERLTDSGACIGSAPYMAPEQWHNAELVGLGADIYSLGVVTYEALSGHVPFPAESTGEYFEKHQSAQVPRVYADPHPDLDRVLRKALAKHPSERYDNVREFAAALRRALWADKRAQLRTSAQQWAYQNRPPGLLWGPDVLADLERRPPSGALPPLERSFVAESQRRARRRRWVLRSLIALAAVAGLGVGVMRIFMAAQRAELEARLAKEQTRAAQQVTEATAIQSELEQGRAALLHGEPEAALHLRRAYQRGDHSPSTEFMLARALQPRLAKQARFVSSFGRMWSAAFSPDGRQIVTTDDRGAQVRDAQTYQLLFELPHGSEVYQSVYSTDGARLVTVAEDAVRIWDANSGALIHKLTRKRNDGYPMDYYVGAISRDGRLVSAINAAGSVAQVWDAVTGAPLVELRNQPMESPALAFSSDDHWLATTGGDDVRIFDTRTWEPASAIRGPRIHRLAFDPDSPRLVTGATTGDAAIWAIPSGKRVHHLRELGESVDAVAFSPDGRLVIAGSRDGAVQVWRARSGELQSQFNPRHTKINVVEFDRASKLVLAAHSDGAVVVGNVALGVPVSVLEAPQSVLTAHFDPSSRRVVGAALDGTAWVWDASSPYHRWSSPPRSDDCGIVTTPEPGRRFVAVGCRDRATRVWDTARDQLVAELPSVTHVEGGFTSAFPAVSGAGDRAAIARGNTVEVYELPAGRLLRTIAHGAAVNAVAFSGMGREIVSGAIDGTLLVTQDDGTQRALPDSPGGIDAVAFLPDGRLVSSDAQRRLRVYDRHAAVLANLELPTRAMSLRIAATRLATVPFYAGGAASPVLVDLERHRIVARLEGHVGRVFSARWVAQGQILTAGADGTARLWDGTTGRILRTYPGGSRSLYDAMLASGGLVIAGSVDGRLWFWDQGSGRPLWVLQAHASPIIGVHAEGGDIVTRGITGELSRWTLPSPGQVLGACGDHLRCAIVH